MHTFATYSIDFIICRCKASTYCCQKHGLTSLSENMSEQPPLTLDTTNVALLVSYDGKLIRPSSSGLLGHGFLKCVGGMLSLLSCWLLEIMNMSMQVDAGWDLTFPRVRGGRGVRHVRACKTLILTLANTGRKRRMSFLSTQKSPAFFALDMKY